MYCYTWHHYVKDESVYNGSMPRHGPTYKARTVAHQTTVCKKKYDYVQDKVHGNMANNVHAVAPAYCV